LDSGRDFELSLKDEDAGRADAEDEDEEEDEAALDGAALSEEGGEAAKRADLLRSAGADF
jgi:hypothetical protein